MCLNIAKLPWVAEPLMASSYVYLKKSKASRDGRTSHGIKLGVSKFSKFTINGRTTHGFKLDVSKYSKFTIKGIPLMALI